MSLYRPALVAGLTAGGIFALGGAAAAEGLKTESPWTVEAGIYAFIPVSVEGTSTVDGGAVDLDLGLDEIFDLFQFAISGRLEVWHNLERQDGSGAGFILDGQYVNLGLDDSDIGPAGGGDVDADIRQAMIDFLAAYRFPELTLDEAGGQSVAFDIMAGGRYNFLRQQIDVSPGLPVPFTANLGGDEHWIEPVVGARINVFLSDAWSVILRGDAAGFGVGDNDLSLSFTGLVAWEAWEDVTLRLGYRVFDMDYSKGSGAQEFAYDVTQHGPFLGVSYRF